MSAREDNQLVLKRVTALIQRAQSPTGEDDEEARTSAMQAARMLKDHQLVVVPKSEIERVEQAIRHAHEIAKKSKDEAQQKLIMGVLGGLMLGKKGVF